MALEASKWLGGKVNNQLKVNKQLTISKILNYHSKHVIFEHLWHYESLNDSLGFCERLTDSLESQSEF